MSGANDDWWLKAQQYELRYAKSCLVENGPQVAGKAEPISFFFRGDKHLENKVVDHAEGKVCLEVGPSLWPTSYTLPAKSLIVVEPLGDSLRDQMNLPGHAVLCSVGGELALPDFEGQIDGVIVSRNCINHAQDPIRLLELTLKCGAPGCWLLFWSDLWHTPEPDEGHRNITRNPADLRDIVKKFGYDIHIEFTERFPDYSLLLDYGCVARRRENA